MMKNEWKDCVIVSLDTIRKIAETKSFKSLVWPDEGRMINGKWQFNESHEGFQPLLIDLNSARLMMQAYNGSSVDVRGKIETLIKSRGGFIKLSEVLWKHATFK